MFLWTFFSPLSVSSGYLCTINRPPQRLIITTPVAYQVPCHANQTAQKLYGKGVAKLREKNNHFAIEKQIHSDICSEWKVCFHKSNVDTRNTRVSACA
jgi:hypothetical protein